jgi:ABC-type glycerol-3-phosphate transport system permease component
MSIVMVVVGVTVAALFFGSAIAFARDRNRWRFMQLVGSVFLVVVVLAHVAEEFRLLPGMGWGRPDSPGHYLDLFSAIAGVILLSLGCDLAKRRNSK